MQYKIEYNLISCGADLDIINKMMRNADLYDESKIIASSTSFIITTEGNTDFYKLTETLKVALESQGKHIIYLGIFKINGERSIATPIVDYKIRQFIVGGKVYFMDDILKLSGFKVETDDRRFVKKISL